MSAFGAMDLETRLFGILGSSSSITNQPGSDATVTYMKKDVYDEV